LIVTCAINFARLPGSSLPDGVGVGARFPNKESASIDGLVFRLLYELDHEISKVYKNEKLWN
jgi:hypothetical protein